MADNNPKKPPAKRDDPKQSERFIKAAREIGADEAPEAMERAFKKVKPHQPARPKESS